MRACAIEPAMSSAYSRAVDGQRRAELVMKSSRVPVNRPPQGGLLVSHRVSRSARGRRWRGLGAGGPGSGEWRGYTGGAGGAGGWLPGRARGRARRRACVRRRRHVRRVGRRDGLLPGRRRRHRSHLLGLLLHEEPHEQPDRHDEEQPETADQETRTLREQSSHIGLDLAFLADLAALARPDLRGQTVEVDEALGRLVVEAVGRVVGGEVVVVERVRAAAADGHARSLEEAQAHVAGHELLRGLDEAVERLFERREPHAVVDELGPLLLDAELVVQHLTLEAQVLERLVRGDERERARNLVDLAALHADEAVLDHVDAAETVAARRARSSR